MSAKGRKRTSAWKELPPSRHYQRRDQHDQPGEAGQPDHRAHQFYPVHKEAHMRCGPRTTNAHPAPWLMLMTLSSCGEERRPPASFMVGDLPVSGSLADARRAGFTACIPTNADMRCRREGVFFERQGPFSAAVDLMMVMEPVASII